MLRLTPDWPKMLLALRKRRQDVKVGILHVVLVVLIVVHDGPRTVGQLLLGTNMKTLDELRELLGTCRESMVEASKGADSCQTNVAVQSGDGNGMALDADHGEIERRAGVEACRKGGTVGCNRGFGQLAGQLKDMDADLSRQQRKLGKGGCLVGPAGTLVALVVHHARAEALESGGRHDVLLLESVCLCEAGRGD